MTVLPSFWPWWPRKEVYLRKKVSLMQKRQREWYSMIGIGWYFRIKYMLSPRYWNIWVLGSTGTLWNDYKVYTLQHINWQYCLIASNTGTQMFQYYWHTCFQYLGPKVYFFCIIFMLSIVMSVWIEYWIFFGYVNLSCQVSRQRRQITGTELKFQLRSPKLDF